MKDDDIPFLVENLEATDTTSVAGALPFAPKELVERISASMKSDEFTAQVAEICAKVGPDQIDPNNDHGVSEVEVSLVITAEAGVRLLGEVRGATQASLKVKIQRK